MLIAGGRYLAIRHHFDYNNRTLVFLNGTDTVLQYQGSGAAEKDGGNSH